jgi:hypothetical protein
MVRFLNQDISRTGITDEPVITGDKTLRLSFFVFDDERWIYLQLVHRPHQHANVVAEYLAKSLVDLPGVAKRQPTVPATASSPALTRPARTYA